jgi:hypothetical protein
LTSVGVLNGTLPLFARIVTRASSDCPAGAPLVLTLKASVSESGRLLDANKSFHTAVGDTTVINIKRWLEKGPNHRNGQWIRFSTISARGLSQAERPFTVRCAAHEVIGVPHLVIVRNGAALSFLPGTQALTITALK